MVCGRSYHGGDDQPGCGHNFDWGSAQPYRVQIARRELPPMCREHLGVRGRDVFHPFVRCSLCGSAAEGIAGLRFRCIHCPSFDVCSNCEPKLGDLHDPQHVFEIMFESGCDWDSVGHFPAGTRVRIVRHGDRLPKSLTRCAASELEGLCGKVQGKRRGPLAGYKVELDLGQGVVELASEHLEPLLASCTEAAALLAKMVDPEEEVTQQVASSSAAPAGPGDTALHPWRMHRPGPHRPVLEEDPLSDDSLSD